MVYPLKETNGNPVTITVSYSGLESQTLSVQVDYSVGITALHFQDSLRLNRLNQYFDLPRPRVELSDGTITDLSDHYTISYEIPEFARDYLTVSHGRIRSSRPILDDSPVSIRVWSNELNGIEITLPLAAEDAVPTVGVSVQSAVSPGDRIDISISASDDVEVAEVRLFQGQTLVASFVKPPWQFFTQALNQDEGKRLTFYAEATDSAGQIKRSVPSTVLIESETGENAPELQFEKPHEMQRCVAKSPARFQLSKSTGETPEPTGVQFVEYFLDGAKIGESYFPFFEVRKEKTVDGEIDVWYEVWRLDRDLPEISTHETSMSYYAVIHGSRGGERSTEPGLIRIVRNQPPSVELETPYPDTSVAFGQVLPVKAVMSDDTLGGGTRLELLVDGDIIDSYLYRNPVEMYGGDYLNRVTRHTFQYDVPERPAGTALRIALRATDYHGVLFQTEPVSVRMKNDSPPMAALISPQEGAQLVAGLPFEMRAEAEDDVGVSRVDFYVDGRLVGSDSTTPYQFIYQKIGALHTTQALMLKAIAVDTKGQPGESGAVAVTLGRDEIPPVVYIVSPEVSDAIAGVDTAVMVEGETAIIKLTGYDNVNVSKLKLTGIKKTAAGYTLSRNPDDVLEGDAFLPQAVPGTLQAFSALVQVDIPPFTGSAGSLDLYDVTATAWDKADNMSERTLQIGVANDAPPNVIQVVPNKDRVFHNDSVHIDIHGSDDLGVDAFELTWKVEGSSLPPIVERYDKRTGESGVNEIGFNPGKVVQLSIDKAIDSLGFSFEQGSSTILLTVKAIDELGQISESLEASLTVVEDTQPPQLSIYSPISGSKLFKGSAKFDIPLKFKAVDDCLVTHISLKVSGSEDAFFSKNYSGISAEDSCTLTLPAGYDEDAVTVVMEATDVSGLKSQFQWTAYLTDDPSPVVTILSPGSGTRFVEGESFTANLQSTLAHIIGLVPRCGCHIV